MGNDIQRFFTELDEIYAENRFDKLEKYLKDQLAVAESTADKGFELTILNELMGYFRASSRYEECITCINRTLKLVEELGLKNSISHATTLLNAATGYRAAGYRDKALEFYNQALDIYLKELEEGDYRIAALYNNISILYGEMGERQKEKQALIKALNIIEKVEGAKVEEAIAHSNLALMYSEEKDTENALLHVKKSLEIFEENNNRKDSHYAAALSTCAMTYYRMGKYQEAVEFFEKALAEIYETYGENDYYKITKENLNTAREALENEGNTTV